MSEQHGGLRVGVVAGVGISEESKIHNRWACSEEVTNYLTMQLGMAVSREPNYACPELTVEDLTTPDSQAYTEIYAKRTSWFGFLSERKADHDAMVIEISAEMEDIETNIRESIRKNNKRTTRGGETKNVPASEMEDAINMSPRYVELKQKLVFHREVLVRLNARVEKLDRELRLTSRQVEIRRLDFDTTQRQSNLGNHGGGPPRGMGYPSNRNRQG